ncbi:MAG: 50S ribosomal protein L24 [Phycisphaerales bacterium]
MPRHVRKGDTVIVTAGDDKGRTGTVLQVIPKSDQVVVQGINVKTKHLKPTQQNPQGGVITKEMPLHISNVSPMVDGRATRVRFEKKDDGTKVRVAARNGDELSTVHRAKKKRAKKGAEA